MSASNRRTQGTAILLLGKISALPGKGAALLSAPHRAGGGGGAASLCASLCPTLRRVLQIPAPTGIVIQGNPAFKSREVVPAYFS